MNSFRKSSSEADAPPDIANYAILQSIGRGGYGEVWLGRSVTGNLRAIKVVRRDNFQSEKAFEREFEGIKRYEQVSQDHTGLVDILHVGRDAEGQFYYYVMELADDVSRGREISPDDYKPATLIQRMRPGKKLAVAECVELGVTLAEALGRLHARELAHRDVKPSNIIYVRGKPRLADPGLVAQSGQDTFVGTEGYVPPEGPGSAQADLYGLGMVLYEMSTGKDRMEFPELPTLMDPEDDDFQARVDLNTFICRACAPRPKQRFADAKAFSVALAKIGGGVAAPVRKGPPLLMIAFAIILLAALGAGGWFVKSKMKPKRGTEEELALRDKTFGHASAVPVPVRPPTPEEEEKAAAAAAAKAKADAESEAAKARLTPTPEPTPTPPVEMAKVEPSIPIPTPTPPAPPVIGSVKLFSSPSAATVFLNGEKLGSTPYPFDNQPGGEYEFTFKLKGYKDKLQRVKVGPGPQPSVVVTLQTWQPPIAGQPWKNSLALPFDYVPEENGHRSSGLVGISLFKRFMDENPGKEYPHSDNLAFGIVYADVASRYAFCQWLTKLDRTAGYLDETTQIHMPEVVEPLEGSFDQASFQLFVGAPRKGSISIKTNADPVDVYEVGETVKKIGVTPFQPKDLLVGPVHYELRKPGYKTTVLRGEVTYPEPLEYIEELEFNQSAVFGQEWKNSLEMTFVPAGPHLLASKYETRVKDYEKFWDEVDAIGPKYYEADFAQGGDHPVVNVSYKDAERFCEWLTKKEREQNLIFPNQAYRLPTDQEWSRLVGIENEKGSTPEERDAMAVDLAYPWGPQWPPPAINSVPYGNYADVSASFVLENTIPGYNDGIVRTTAVSDLLPNALGLHNLSGNVWEFVSDPESHGNAIMRGGGWADYRQDLLRSAARLPNSLDARDPACGFRIVLAEME